MIVRPDRLHSVIMGWLVLTTLVMPPVVLTRSLIQADYRWSHAGFSGTGMEGDLWYVIAVALFAATMLWFGWRGARMPFHAMAVLWTGALSAMFAVGLIEHGQAMRLRADTLGIDIWLGWFLPAHVLFAALTAGWVVRDLRRKRPPVESEWQRRNTIGLTIAVVLWITAAVLFRIGDLHGASDVAAVFCMFAFWIILNVWGLREPHAGKKEADGE